MYDKLISDALQTDPRLRALETKNDAESAEKARQLREEIKKQWRSLADATLKTYNSLKFYAIRQSGIPSGMPAGGSGTGKVLSSKPKSPK